MYMYTHVYIYTYDIYIYIYICICNYIVRRPASQPRPTRAKCSQYKHSKTP